MTRRTFCALAGFVAAFSSLLPVSLAAPAATSATTAPAVTWSGKRLTLAADQSSGGVLVELSNGMRGVALDRTCERPWPEVTCMEWKLATPLPAGWWRGTVELSAREGDDKGWVNHQLGVVLLSPEKPLANMMLNFRPAGGTGPQRFEFWTYISAPAGSVRIQDVYSQLYKWKRTWPILQVTLEQVEPAGFTATDVVALDLPVQKDGSVQLPRHLPPGLWSLRAAMTKEGEMLCEGEDGRTIRGQFSFDRWRRPANIHFYSASPLKKLSFRTSAMFKSAVLENSLIHPAQSLPADGQLMTTVDPGKSESATLEIIGANLAGDAPALPTFAGGAKTAVVTTWDDGETSDLRLAEILNRLGYHPTFFLNQAKPAMKSLDKLEAMNAEVGSHCWNHPFLHILPPERALEECVAMRKLLEKELKHPVISFSYPNGYTPAYDAEGDYVLRAMRAAGYWSGRTTAGASETVDSIAEPLTLKVNGFFGDRKGLEKAWEETRAREGGIFHFWGHSWQIGKTDEQWKEFEDFAAKFAKQPGTWYPSQGELFLWIWARKNVRIAVTEKSEMKVNVTITRPWLHPWLAAKLPLSLRVPAGTQKVIWQGREVAVKDGCVELPWTKPNRE